MHKKPKTDGLEWLILSLMAFNGSGYADMNSAEDFLESYIAYKLVKKKPEAVFLARQYKDVVLPTLEDLLAKTAGSNREPSKKMLGRLQAQRNTLELF